MADLGTLIDTQGDNSKQFLSSALNDNANLGGVYQGQSDLEKYYRDLLTNPNAPSVAKTMLSKGLQTAQNQQLSAVSGTSGENAGLARRNAANNLVALDQGANQTAAELRAKEVADAAAGLGTTLQGQGALQASAAATNTGAANQAQQNETAAQLQANEDKQKQNNYWTDFFSKLAGGAIQGGAGAATAYGLGAGGAAPAVPAASTVLV